MRILTLKNVNHALRALYFLVDEERFEENPNRRGNRVMEYPEPVITEYLYPAQKVLFDPVRDANPFFHLFESLWIFSGARDVETLAYYLPSIADYSDDGETFNAAYGHRLRVHFDVDQLLAVIHNLQADPWTRRAFMILGDPFDLYKASRDVACNVSVFFNRTPGGRLDMTVNNRSNDAVWGAYGANAVQFGSIHQFVCEATKLPLGVYRQFSNNFHYYPDAPATHRVLTTTGVPIVDDRYANHSCHVPYFLRVREEHFTDFLGDCIELGEKGWRTQFGRAIVNPMAEAFYLHKQKATKAAIALLADSIFDWHVAGREWLERRLK